MDKQAPSTKSALEGIEVEKRFRAYNWVFDTRLFDPELSAEERDRVSESTGLWFWRRVRERVPPENLCNICFLDVAAIVAPGKTRGFVLAPSKATAETYLEAIELLLDRSQSIADHPVFEAGMPFSTRFTSLVESERELRRAIDDISRLEDDEAPVRRFWVAGFGASPYVDRGKGEQEALNEVACVPLGLRPEATGKHRCDTVDGTQAVR